MGSEMCIRDRVKDIDNAQFNNVLFKEALENVKNIYISNGLSQ